MRKRYRFAAPNSTTEAQRHREKFPFLLRATRVSVGEKQEGRALARPGVRRQNSAAVARRLHGLPRNIGGRRDALHTQLEVVGVGSVLESGLVVDQAGLEEVPERLIESLHAVLRGTCGNRVTKKRRLFGTRLPPVRRTTASNLSSRRFGTAAKLE